MNLNIDYITPTLVGFFVSGMMGRFWGELKRDKKWN
tara:strand:- start:319 stop:426 length:108 start_codon:yes stop_codon:yes gene_type:complete